MDTMRLWLFGELATELGVEYHTIRDLTKAWGLKPSRVPRSPAGKGLDLEQVIVLCRALNRPDMIEHFRSEHEIGTRVRPAYPIADDDDCGSRLRMNRPA